MYKISFKHFGFPSYFGKPLFLEGKRRISIGSRVRIFPGIRLEAIGQGSIVIEDDVAIEQNVHITSENDELRICKGTVILGCAFISNIDHEYRDVKSSIIKQAHLFKRTFIGEDCFIGFGAKIQAGTILGKHCIIGAGAVVRGHFPDYCVIVGVPARIIKKYDFAINKWVNA